MPMRKVAQRELVSFLAVLAHPLRLALIFALAGGEQDVSSLTVLVAAPQTAVSQALARLRAARLVRERRDGRHVVYTLTLHTLPRWLDGGFALLIDETTQAASLRDAILFARKKSAGATTRAARPSARTAAPRKARKTS